MFGMTAKEWKNTTGIKDGNIRDYATVEQLIVLTNLESFNAEFISRGMLKEARIRELNKIAVKQMESFSNNKAIAKLTEK